MDEVDDSPFWLIQFRDRSTAILRFGVLAGIPLMSGSWEQCAEHQRRICDLRDGLFVLRLLPEVRGCKAPALRRVREIMINGWLVHPIEPMPLLPEKHFVVTGAHKPTGKRDVFVTLEGEDGLFLFYDAARRRYLFEPVETNR